MRVIEQIYKLRQDFILIGLTGRTGSGCSTVAGLLKEENFSKLKSEHKEFRNGTIDNNVRKNRIVYKYMKEHWKPFTIIKASDVIFYYALMLDNFDEFKENLFSSYDSDKINREPKKCLADGMRNSLNGLSQDFQKLHEVVLRCDEYLNSKKYRNNTTNINEFKCLLLSDIPKFRQSLDEKLEQSFRKVIGKDLQSWGNNIRTSDSVLSSESNIVNEKSPACLAHKINQFVKMFRVKDKEDKRPTMIVIDALRNPYEILYFRERYSAFYTLSVNTAESIRKNNLSLKGYRIDEINEIDEEEKRKKELNTSYEKIDIDKCIELSDIHLTHDGTPVSENRNLINQIVTYLALILHPGLVPPSPLERVMQIAYTAKLNSGCLSRQVGAVVTNEFYSVKSIGWNTVAEGQTPCTLRDMCDLCCQEDSHAFSNYEQHNEKFKNYVEILVNRYEPQRKNLTGLPLAYCFKDIYTTVEDQQRNQVHIRSLHAEENAFLQLAKYGAPGIKGGKLFTTASCCELCAKKAYQLGIKEIYYIDSYPGISKQHILECGDYQPKLILFTGAVGRAYINLYNPFIPQKDEIESLTGVKVKKMKEQKQQRDETKKNREEINDGDSNKNRATKPVVRGAKPGHN